MIMLFFLGVFCVATVTGQSHYDQLSPDVKFYVDKALVEANQQINHGHLNFDKIGIVAEIGPWVRLDVRLKNTVCRKAVVHKHRPECAFKLLQVRCIVCSWGGRPLFIDCVRFRDQATRFAEWRKHCSGCAHSSCYNLINELEDETPA